MRYEPGVGVVETVCETERRDAPDGRGTVSIHRMVDRVAVDDAALAAGLVTHQDWRAGSLGEVVDGVHGPVLASDVRAALDAAGVAHEYRARVVRVAYEGGNMRDGYGGATAYRGHMPGLLRIG